MHISKNVARTVAASALCLVAAMGVAACGGNSSSEKSPSMEQTMTPGDAMTDDKMMDDGTMAPSDAMTDDKMGDGSMAPDDAMSDGAMTDSK